MWTTKHTNTTMRSCISSQFLLLSSWLARNHLAWGQDPCSICPDGEVVTLPDAIIPEEFAFVLDVATTCAELEARLASGDFEPTECALLRAYGVGNECGCMAPVAPTVAPVVQSVTPAPAVPESSAPTVQAVVTPAPTVPESPAPVVPESPAPVVVPTTSAPTAAATQVPVAASPPPTAASSQ